MWGLWLVAGIPEVQQQSAAACQLAGGQLQCHTKIDFFQQKNTTKRMTFTQQPTG